jgi:cytochrome P450
LKNSNIVIKAFTLLCQHVILNEELDDQKKQLLIVNYYEVLSTALITLSSLVSSALYYLGLNKQIKSNALKRLDDKEFISCILKESLRLNTPLDNSSIY